ncbi:MAG: RluA family pseudouridine synthase [Candidatus Cyclobacteriaceae bacterium M3_2C_046]
MINFKTLIIYENDDFMVINKPAGISSLSDRHDENNVLEQARTYAQNAQICHRLDKETSGVMVIAKNAEAYRHMAMQLEKRQVKKAYHAMVEGIHSWKQKRIEVPIATTHKAYVKADSRKGKDAITLASTLETFKIHSLIACYPVTGRMHQVRFHLSSAGAPIVMDHTYGGKPLFLSQLKKKYKLGKFKEEQPLIKRVALHAYEITFKLLDQEAVTVRADYSHDFEVMLKQVKKYS